MSKITRAEIIIRLLRGETIIAQGNASFPAWQPFYELLNEGLIDYYTQHKSTSMRNQYIWKGEIIEPEDWIQFDQVYEVELHDEI